MLTEIQNDILTALDDVTAFRERGVWQGDLDTLLNTPQKLPSVHVALATGAYGPPVLIPPTDSLLDMSWDVIVAYECLKDRRVAADQGYGLIEAVVAKLKGMRSQGRLLWPVSFDLLESRNGKSAYAIRFTIDKEV
jgi:hypothetical protein